jgi:hypothetical protein
MVLIDLETTFNTKFLTTYTPYVRTELHTLNSKDLVVIAIKSKDKYRFHAAAIFLSYILKKTFTNIAYFSNMCYHT